MGVYSRLLESRGNKDGEEPQAPQDAPSAAPPVAAAEPFELRKPSAGPAEQLLTNVGRQVQDIFDAAERIAEELRADAEASATRLLEDRKREADQAYAERLRALERVTATLTDRADRIQREVAALAEDLKDVTQLAGEGPAPAASPKTGSSGPQPVAYPGRGAARSQEIREGAALRATQMAVAGAERAQIELMLRTEFGIANPTAFVDETLSGRS